MATHPPAGGRPDEGLWHPRCDCPPTRGHHPHCPHRADQPLADIPGHTPRPCVAPCRACTDLHLQDDEWHDVTVTDFPNHELPYNPAWV